MCVYFCVCKLSENSSVCKLQFSLYISVVSESTHMYFCVVCVLYRVCVCVCVSVNLCVSLFSGPTIVVMGTGGTVEDVGVDGSNWD